MRSFSIILILKGIIGKFKVNETESKMENPTHTFRGKSIKIVKINSKTGMSCSSQKKKKPFFVPFISSDEITFNIFVLSQCIVY